MQNWWQDGSDASVEAAFSKHSHRVWEARECNTLMFVLHYRNYFTLVVGYIDERRWEFYNSLAGDRLTRSKAEQLVSMVYDPKLQSLYIHTTYDNNYYPIFPLLQIGWLNAMYMHFGWIDPFLWTTLIKKDIPHQHNGNDCGVFAVAFEEHYVHRRPITFTQADIPYFRS